MQRFVFELPGKNWKYQPRKPSDNSSTSEIFGGVFSFKCSV